VHDSRLLQSIRRTAESRAGEESPAAVLGRQRVGIEELLDRDGAEVESSMRRSA